MGSSNVGATRFLPRVTGESVGGGAATSKLDRAPPRSLTAEEATEVGGGGVELISGGEDNLNSVDVAEGIVEVGCNQLA
jgi:hypothetical protein